MVGFSAKNLNLLNPLYICLRCLLLLRDPVQLIDCGHRLCRTCANELLEGDMILCPGCHKKISGKNLILDRGFKNDMQILLIECSFCNWIDILKNYSDHLNQMHSNPICEYCEQKFSDVYHLGRHKLYDCEKITVNCPFKEFGCEKMILRINLRRHYQSEEHQNVLINIFHQMKTSSVIKNDRLHETETLQEVDETVSILSGGVKVLNDDLQRVKNQSIFRENELDSLMKEFPTLKISIQEQNDFVDNTKINQEQLQQDVTTMEQKINDKKTSSYDGTLIWKITNVQEKFAEAIAERQTSFYSSPFYSSPSGYKMCGRLYLNGDGNARGTHISLFFVLMRGDYDAILKFPFNYKITFCLYDQTNQQHHISDSFRPDIKSNSFQRPRTDMNIASGLPKFVPLEKIRQENTPYIRDNTMFIKIMVDFSDIPKGLLTYALSLNPGLTAPIQQKLIQEEHERRQQQSKTNTQTNQSTASNLQHMDTLSTLPKPNDSKTDEMDHG